MNLEEDLLIVFFSLCIKFSCKCKVKYLIQYMTDFI